MLSIPNPKIQNLKCTKIWKLLSTDVSQHDTQKGLDFEVLRILDFHIRNAQQAMSANIPKPETLLVLSTWDKRSQPANQAWSRKDNMCTGKVSVCFFFFSNYASLQQPLTYQIWFHIWKLFTPLPNLPFFLLSFITSWSLDWRLPAQNLKRPQCLKLFQNKWWNSQSKLM